MLSSLKDSRDYHNRNTKNKNSMFHAHVLIVYVPQSQRSDQTSAASRSD